MGGGNLKATGGALGAVIVVAVLGYGLFSSQLSMAQLIEELLGSSEGWEASAAQAIPYGHTTEVQGGGTPSLDGPSADGASKALLQE
jgi:hypothetical protein